MGIVWATLESKRRLEARLAELIASRGKAAQDISTAREFGDLSENAEYAAAKEAQNNLENEIIKIQEMLGDIKLFNYQKCDTNSVNLGTKVELINKSARNKKETVIITGVLESDPTKDYISNESPKGKALMGKKVGDIATLKVPAGLIRYEIVKISAGA
ncbi:MAG: transcription elongation factor GreA [Christensenellaceae bacterium]|jgi:transcription elongation factor GreA|nr:transcription elongation factor GreA [Christensenellaceae bacterium]